MGRYANPAPSTGKAALIELVRDKKKAEAIYDSLFDTQKKALDDPCRHKVLCTTRRSGKTTVIIADFLIRALENPLTSYVYIALTFRSAKKIAWDILKKFNRDYKLGMRFQEASLTAVLPNGSYIDLVGGDSPTLGDRLYGIKLAGCAIDEAAFFSISLSSLVKDNISPALVDLQGVMWLASIPGRHPGGLYYYLTEQFDYRVDYSGATPANRTECATASRWSFHSWTFRDNPFMADSMQKEVDDELEANPNAEKDPIFLRTFCKAWVVSKNELVYKYDPNLNVDEVWKSTNETQYVLSVDLGWKDCTTIVVLAYEPGLPDIWVIDMWKDNETLLDVVAEEIRNFLDIYGKDSDIVCDQKHLYIFEQLRRGYNLPIMEAEKTQKYEAIQVLNSSLLRGDLKVINPDPETSPLIQEWTSLRWKILPTGKKIEQPGQTNDCADAVLTGFRHVQHYIDLEPEIDERTTSEIREDELVDNLEQYYRGRNAGIGCF